MGDEKTFNKNDQGESDHLMYDLSESKYEEDGDFVSTLFTFLHIYVVVLIVTYMARGYGHYILKHMNIFIKYGRYCK